MENRARGQEGTKHQGKGITTYGKTNMKFKTKKRNGHKNGNSEVNALRFHLKWTWGVNIVTFPRARLGHEGKARKGGGDSSVQFRERTDMCQHLEKGNWSLGEGSKSIGLGQAG